MRRLVAGVLCALSALGGCATADPGDRAAIKQIPLVERPLPGASGDALVILITGDGGWAKIDRVLAATFLDAGVPVIGLNSLRYFFWRKSPERLADDLRRMIEHYGAAWSKKKVFLVGYSRGAEVLPFAINRLPPDVRKSIALLALIGPDATVDFEIHFYDIFNMTGKSDLPVMPELEKLRGEKIVCFYGREETDSLCTAMKDGLATVVPLKGRHHFGEDYPPIAKRILKEAGK